MLSHALDGWLVMTDTEDCGQGYTAGRPHLLILLEIGKQTHWKNCSDTPSATAGYSGGIAPDLLSSLRV